MHLLPVVAFFRVNIRLFYKGFFYIGPGAFDPAADSGFLYHVHRFVRPSAKARPVASALHRLSWPGMVRTLVRRQHTDMLTRPGLPGEELLKLCEQFYGQLNERVSFVQP
jgi:hypothetical protein